MREPRSSGQELVDRHRDAIRAAARGHRARAISLFGSAARGEDRDGSDLDFLVEFEPGSSLSDLVHLQDDLEALLGRSVDIVSIGGLKPRDDHIRREAVAI